MKNQFKTYSYYFILLFLFWIILSQRFTLEIALIGAGAVGLIMLYSKKLLFTPEETTLYNPGKILIFVKFIFIMLIEILKSNWQVAKIVLSPSLPISPTFVKIHKTFEKDFDKVIFGNSVTLTPGTLTVDIDEEGFLVHALTTEAAEGLEDSIIEEFVRKLEAE
jgi:multicomponent Na+:H+ antiporter subunit E